MAGLLLLLAAKQATVIRDQVAPSLLRLPYVASLQRSQAVGPHGNRHALSPARVENSEHDRAQHARAENASQRQSRPYAQLSPSLDRTLVLGLSFVYARSLLVVADGQRQWIRTGKSLVRGCLWPMRFGCCAPRFNERAKLWKQQTHLPQKLRHLV